MSLIISLFPSFLSLSLSLPSFPKKSQTTNEDEQVLFAPNTGQIRKVAFSASSSSRSVGPLSFSLVSEGEKKLNEIFECQEFPEEEERGEEEGEGEEEEEIEVEEEDLGLFTPHMRVPNEKKKEEKKDEKKGKGRGRGKGGKEKKKEEVEEEKEEVSLDLNVFDDGEKIEEREKKGRERERERGGGGGGGARKKNPWMTNETQISQKGDKKEKGEKKRKEKGKEEEEILDTEKVISSESLKKTKINLLSEETTEEQREIIQAAFEAGGTEMEKEFRREKEKLLEKESTAKEEIELPGWGGSWVGEGARESKRNIERRDRKRKEREAETERLRKKRKDSLLTDVIISEKGDTLNRKYKTQTVPFPFKTIEQYERTLQTPLGRDWNTLSVYNERIKPRVRVRKGEYIQPMTMEVKQKLEERKKEGERKRREASGGGGGRGRGGGGGGGKRGKGERGRGRK